MNCDPVKSLFITLTRSFAGTKSSQRKILESLGFQYRLQTLERQNNPSVRGAIRKVIHLVRVETDEGRRQRLMREEEARRPREPFIVQHT